MASLSSAALLKTLEVVADVDILYHYSLPIPGRGAKSHMEEGSSCQELFWSSYYSPSLTIKTRLNFN